MVFPFHNFNMFVTQKCFHVSVMMIPSSTCFPHQSSHIYRFVFLYCGSFVGCERVLNSHTYFPTAAERCSAVTLSLSEHKNQSHEIFLCQSLASRPVHTLINQKVASPLLDSFFIITFRLSKKLKCPFNGPVFC